MDNNKKPSVEIGDILFHLTFDDEKSIETDRANCFYICKRIVDDVSYGGKFHLKSDRDDEPWYDINELNDCRAFETNRTFLTDIFFNDFNLCMQKVKDYVLQSIIFTTKTAGKEQSYHGNIDENDIEIIE